MLKRSTLCLFSSFILLAACSDADEPADVNTQDVTINLSAQFGDKAFDCDTSYEKIGRGEQTYTPNDARAYVHAIELLNDQGEAVDVQLSANNFQAKGVVLLDFEDGTGNCSNGTTQTNTKIVGKVPEGTYTGVRFKLGVPESLNHQNQATAPAPLNISGMFWSWQNGYKFLKVDGKTEALTEGVLLHLGATMCEGTEPNITCQNDNRPAVELTGWSADKTVVLDMANLFKDAHLDADEGGPKGCMSGPTDPDCAPIFKNLGLSGSTQTVFRIK